eukprot:366124-Chlamydomonas_euryale.AAC.11
MTAPSRLIFDRPDCKEAFQIAARGVQHTQPTNILIFLCYFCQSHDFFHATSASLTTTSAST